MTARGTTGDNECQRTKTNDNEKKPDFLENFKKRRTKLLPRIASCLQKHDSKNKNM